MGKILYYKDDGTLYNGKIYYYINKKKLEEEGVAKYYVGQTRFTLNQRAGLNGVRYTKDNDSNPSYSKFANAIRKWGWDAFEGHIIVDGIKNQEELNSLEMFYIKYFDSYNNGYNCTHGGDGVSGAKHVGMYGKTFTDEHRRKLSESHKGQPSHMKGKHHTEETKRKISEKIKALPNDHMKGKHHTEETKKILSEKAKIIQNSPEMIANNRLQAIGNKHAIRYKVKCNELNMEFDCIMDTVRYITNNGGKVDPANISFVCKGKRSHAGTLNGIKLSWKYIDNDYANND